MKESKYEHEPDSDEKKLWSAADELRANSNLRGSDYSTPVLGLIFLRYADHKFTLAEQEIGNEPSSNSRGQIDKKTQFQARGVFYLPEKARFQYLLNLPESENTGQALTNAMKAIEAENKQVEGFYPKTSIDLKRAPSLNFYASWNKFRWILKVMPSVRSTSTFLAILL